MRPVLPVANASPTAEDELLVAEIAPEPARETNLLGVFGSIIEWLFGTATLLLALAVLTAVPIGQFLVFGYLLEATNRVARSGRLRDGFIGVRAAARWGAAALAAGLLWLPLYGLSIVVESARIIDPGGPAARQWELLLTVLAGLFAIHVVAASLRGGRVRDFARPLNAIWLVRRVFRGGAYREARDRFWAVLVGLRLPFFFWLGLRGYLGGLLWLAIPLALLGLAHTSPAAGIVGGVLLGIVVLYLPFLQVRFVRENRLRAYFKLGSVRADYRRAPLAFAFALTFHLLCAMPLYVLKIEMIPRDLVFLEGLAFLGFIVPARLIDGWAYARAARRTEPRHLLLRWAGRFAVLPAVVAYVLVVFASQHVGWNGIPSLYEQHAFLLPVPFTTFDR